MHIAVVDVLRKMEESLHRVKQCYTESKYEKKVIEEQLIAIKAYCDLLLDSQSNLSVSSQSSVTNPNMSSITNAPLIEQDDDEESGTSLLDF